MQLLNHVIDDLAGLNLTYEIFLVPDGKFGTMDDNGGWFGAPPYLRNQ
jgi:hypothetical protein